MSAFDFPADFFGWLKIPSGIGVGLEAIRLAGRGAAREGRKGEPDLDVGPDEANEYRNCTAACFLDKIG